MKAAAISLKDANAFVAVLHRHNGKLPAAKFCIAAIDDEGRIHGVAVAGLPKARLLMSPGTLEINRICTDGTRNCCTFLYGCCKRAAQALGYRRLITYTHQDEPGTSLKASGWTLVGEAGGGSWVEQRGTGTLHDNPTKHRWEIRWGEDLEPLVLPSDVQIERDNGALNLIDHGGAQ